MTVIKRLVLPLAPLVVLAAVLGACTNRVVMQDRPLLICPVPVPECRPGSFTEITIDTGSAGVSSYMRISRVGGLDTEIDEFGIAFPTGTMARADGLATLRFAEGGKENDEIHRTRLIKVDEASLVKELETTDFVGSVGIPTYIGAADTLLLTGQFPGTVRGDYDVARGKFKQGDYVQEVERSGVSRVVDWDAQPAYSPDGRMLFFASNRRGGEGGTDIWVSRLGADGEWSTPENAGPGVNTPCDDLSPFVTGDGRWLYFSSSGHSTVGGYDIFRSRILGGQFGGAENIGRPVNTPADEIFPSTSAKAEPDTLLYYSSNQSGSNAFDVYVLHRVIKTTRRPTTSGQGTEAADSVRLTGTVRDSDGDPVGGARVTLDERDPPRRVDSTSTDRDGEFEFGIREGKKYDITASHEGSLYGSDEVEVPTYNNRREVRRDVVLLDTVVFRVNFPFDNATDPYEYTLDDNGLPTDRRWTDVIAQAADVLRKLDPSTGVRIEVVGHTDPRGTEAYNIDLGRRRAQFVARELVRRGVREDLLVVRSVGEGIPLTMRPDEPDELYRARLRRVELFRR